MKEFVTLFENIESTTSSNKKIEFLHNYFLQASDEDKLWVIALFSHKRPKRTVNTRLIREWAAEKAQIPLWLFEDTYHVVGDLAETVAKIVPTATGSSDRSLHEWVEFLTKLKDKEEDIKKREITTAWQNLNTSERFLFNKLITGGFRMGVSQKTIAKALARTLEEDESVVVHKLMGNWTPFDTSYRELLLSPSPEAEQSKPYPFYLAYPLEDPDTQLQKISEWIAEYKWDGIRGQLIKRKGELFLWSRGEELITHQFPEFDSFKLIEEDFVVDGEILILKDNEIQNFNTLQKRLGRKAPSAKLQKSSPAIIMLYDIMEMDGDDLRLRSQLDRRKILFELFAKHKGLQLPFMLSESLEFNDMQELKGIRGQARDHGAEGLMLKSKTGEYKVGRKKGDWYKWKVDPLTLDVVMIYAQRGHGRRANLFTDFTFAVWDEDKLVPVAKAYSGLTDSEFREVSRYVRSNTIERYGPVHSVPAELVFEIAFEGVSESSRHKSGVALRFPRILRWRKTKSVKEINTLADIKSMI